MDDLDVIRLAVKEIIAERRIPREGRDVKEKFGEGGESAGGDSYLTHLQVFP